MPNNKLKPLKTGRAKPTASIQMSLEENFKGRMRGGLGCIHTISAIRARKYTQDATAT